MLQTHPYIHTCGWRCCGDILLYLQLKHMPYLTICSPLNTLQQIYDNCWHTKKKEKRLAKKCEKISKQTKKQKGKRMFFFSFFFL